jgi:hypothetical protein
MQKKLIAIRAWSGLFGFTLLVGGTLCLSACQHNDEILPQPAPAYQQPTAPTNQAADDDNTDKPPKDGHGG